MRLSHSFGARVTVSVLVCSPTFPDFSMFFYTVSPFNALQAPFSLSKQRLHFYGCLHFIEISWLNFALFSHFAFQFWRKNLTFYIHPYCRCPMPDHPPCQIIPHARSSPMPDHPPCQIIPHARSSPMPDHPPCQIIPHARIPHARSSPMPDHPPFASMECFSTRV